MKHIRKEQEPIEFSEWKKQDKMFRRGKPNWNRLNADIKNNIRTSLLREQGYICCYCERELSDNDHHIEHLKPKSKNKFPELQLDYTNLLCSCQLELENGEPRHCGNSKGGWFDENLLISPLDPDCEAQFVYNADGHVEPSDDNNVAAKTAINRLQLDIDKLADMRKNAIEPFIIDPITFEEISADEAREFAENYLKEKEENDGSYNEFYTTIKYLFDN